MKVGDKFSVTIEGQTVADAKVSKIEGDIVTMLVPATQVEFKTRTVLTDEGPARPENLNNQHVMLGTEVEAETVDAGAPGSAKEVGKPAITGQPTAQEIAAAIIAQQKAEAAGATGTEPGEAPVESAPALENTPETKEVSNDNN